MMGNNKPIKRANDLFKSISGDDFAERFRKRLGASPKEFAARWVDSDAIAAILAVGSIPANVATAVSDVDLIVLTATNEALPPNGAPEQEVIYSGDVDLGNPQFVSRNIVGFFEGVEVDTVFVSLPTISQIMTGRADRRGAPTALERKMLGRLSKGWPLFLSPSGQEILSSLSDDITLPLSAAVSDFVTAQKYFEDAAAAHDDQDLGLYLGRRSVEFAFRSMLAQEGHLDAGDKWLRLVRAVSITNSHVQHLEEFGRRLLREEPNFRQFLELTKEFLSGVKDQITSDFKYSLAFDVCGQIVKNGDTE